MASNKKAAKPAKKASAHKKAAPVKKAPAKAARPASKLAKPAPKKAVKPAAKKVVAKKPVKSAVKAVKPTAKKSIPVKHSHAPTATKKPELKKQEVKKPEVKNPVAAKEEKKPEVKPVEVKKPTLVSLPQPKKPLPPAKPVKVVIPELRTKTVRKYEPEFTKSVLDQPDQIQMGPTMRYSDVELTEFRELIQKKLDQAKKELAYLQGLITRKDEMGGDETENRYMTMEDGSMSMEREQLAQMASRQINYIDHLEKAMMRIENKTYGICRVTGKLIDKARLRAVPHATLSIEAKQMMNK
ncbi:MAG: TraR/DksA C4-type zinc finger protein [Chitinophagaceae bacterium]|nr:TraR/DksA C4-type zinc finger protein [Chitinophagaceae bacterium]